MSLSHSEMEGDEPILVKVKWHGLPEALSDAWIGLYLTDDDPTMVVPLKFQFCNSSLGLRDDRVGHLNFRVLNYRSDVVFRLFHGWEEPLLVAESPVLRLRKPEFPTGLRLALTSKPGEVAVTWTSAPIFDVDDQGPRVEYSVHDAEGVLVARATVAAEESATYLANEMCGSPASDSGYRNPGTFFTARIAGLAPGSRVAYRVGSPRAWSREAHFRAPLAPGARVKLFAFGDLGQHPTDDSAMPCNDPAQWYCPFDWRFGDPGAPSTNAAMLADHRREAADLVVHNGDISYAMGYSAEWEIFHDNIQALASEVPWMVTLGNHERDWPGTNSTPFGGDDSLGECGIPTMRRFAATPFASQEAPPHDRPWYALTVGVVKLIAISTEHDLFPGSVQHEFIKEALAATDREMTPWVILAGHRPYKVDSDWHGDVDFASYMEEALGRIIENGAVDLVLGGHHHTYQRTCKVSAGRCAAAGMSGVVAWNVGMAGAGLNAVNTTQPEIFDYVDAVNFGYGRIIADRDTLTADFIVGETREVMDTMTLKKPSSLAEGARSTLV